jgi:catechol 2,3-dioxygenase-like lactoylglutathione lyase family enzyme
MSVVTPGLFHRLALAVDDVAAADAWFRRIMGCVPVGRTEGPHQDEPVPNVLEMEGAASQLLWHGGLPLILLGAATPDGVVGRFLARWGAAVHSVAWEVDDMWTVEHRLRQQNIRITGVNVPGRHFFMHPADTDGILMEWTDTSMVGDPRRGHPVPLETAGVVGGVGGIAWVTAVVADAGASAARLAALAGAEPVTGNPTTAVEDVEQTVDVRVGDVVLRLVRPRSAASRYWPVLQRAPRLWSYAVRVADLETALAGLAGAGVKVRDRVGAVAYTDPATTLGIPIEWTDAPA